MFKIVNGFIVRGQCKYIFHSALTNENLAIFKYLSHMQVTYCGELEDIYETRKAKYLKLLRLLQENNIKVLICENDQDWIRDACKDAYVTLIEVHSI